MKDGNRFSVIGKVDLNVLYDQWKRNPVADEYMDPRTGWELKCAYAFEQSVGALLFECCPDSETTYYHFCFYKTEVGAFRSILNVRQCEKGGVRIHAIGIDEDLKTLFLRRKALGIDEVVCVSLTNDKVSKAQMAEVKERLLMEDDETFAIIDNSLVLFVRTPKDVYLEDFNGEFSPQGVLYGYAPEKGDTEQRQDDGDDTVCSVKPVREKRQAGHTAIEELQALIGLENVKRQAEQIVAFAKMQKLAKEKGRIIDAVNLNFAFTGNPGTAKTTAARIFARVMKENGILSRGDLLEVGRADLVAKYTGQTAIKVKELFAKAKGNVLFIDEAYSLVDDWENEFGDEAIATIVQEMENNRDDMIVIFAGYPDKMQSFLSRNPGLRSRVPYTVEFEDYNTEELVAITKLEVTRRGFTLDLAAESVIRTICEAAMKMEDFGNGRFSRNLVEDAIMNAALRVSKLPAEDVPENAYFHLLAEDFKMPRHLKEKTPVRLIGFQAA